MVPDAETSVGNFRANVRAIARAFVIIRKILWPLSQFFFSVVISDIAFVLLNFPKGRGDRDLCLKSLYIHWKFLDTCIRCTTLLPPFFFRNSRLYSKKLVIHLWFKVLFIATTFSHLSGSIRIPRRKNWSSLEASTNRSNFLLLHKTESAGQPGRVPLIETSYSQRENVWRIRRVE